MRSSKGIYLEAGEGDTYAVVAEADKEGLGLGQDDGFGGGLAVLARGGECFEAGLDPGLAALDADGLGVEDDEGAGGHGGAVVDVEVGGDADAQRQGGEAAAGEGLVEHGGDEAAVDDAGVAAEAGAEVPDLDQLAAAAVGPL